MTTTGGVARTTTGPVRVVARGLGVRHPSRLAWALTGVDLVVEPGERVLLTGASGAGKSTLLSALAGILDAEGTEVAGELTVDGASPRAARARLGLLAQDPDSQLVMTRAGDDVAFGLENAGLPRERRERVASPGITRRTTEWLMFTRNDSTAMESPVATASGTLTSIAIEATVSITRTSVARRARLRTVPARSLRTMASVGRSMTTNAMESRSAATTARGTAASSGPRTSTATMAMTQWATTEAAPRPPLVWFAWLAARLMLQGIAPTQAASVLAIPMRAISRCESCRACVIRSKVFMSSSESSETMSARPKAAAAMPGSAWMKAALSSKRRKPPAVSRRGSASGTWPRSGPSEAPNPRAASA